MQSMRHIVLAFCLMVLTAPAALAQGSVQARLVPEETSLRDTGDGVALRLSLSQPVPYRLRLLPAPPRAVLEFNTLDWRDISWAELAGVKALRSGIRGDGWARLVLDLAYPMVPDSVVQTVDPDSGRAVVELILRRADLEAFESRTMQESVFAQNYSDYLLHPDSAPPPRRKPTPRRCASCLTPAMAGWTRVLCATA